MHSSVKSKKSLSSPGGKKYFQQALLKWYAAHVRSYPWVGIKDPYRVWLSEIILQQTRVEQGLPYYEKILAQFPTISALAAAEDQKVFRLWQGLGYYNRCKNMLAAARRICTAYNGVFPATYETILQLPGVGPYTAAAIASFAFDLPHAVVDGNVERLLARYFGLEVAVNTTPGKKAFHALAAELLDREFPARYNQAIMDFGATVCLPRQPRCSLCPLRSNCVAYRQGITNKLPVKTPKRPVKNRYLHYLLLQHGNHIFIRKRPATGIWQNLHDFLLIEHDRPLSLERLSGENLYSAAVEKNVVLQRSYSDVFIHQLTHQKLHIRFCHLLLKHPPQVPAAYFPVDIPQIDLFAFPRPLVKYMALLKDF